MGYLVRMLERQKWENCSNVNDGHLNTPADTITADLKTRSNTLSLWSIDKLEDLSEAVLALAVGRNKITRLDVMILEETTLQAAGLEVKNTPENGHTPVTGFEKSHYDIVELNFEKLGELSKVIIDNIQDTSKCIRFSKGRVSEVLHEGYRENKFNLSNVDPKLEKEFVKFISRKQA